MPAPPPESDAAILHRIGLDVLALDVFDLRSFESVAFIIYAAKKAFLIRESRDSRFGEFASGQQDTLGGHQ